MRNWLFRTLALAALLPLVASAQSDQIIGYKVVSQTPRPDLGKLQVTLEVDYSYSGKPSASAVLDLWVRRNGAHYTAVTGGADVVNAGKGKATLFLWFDPKEAREVVATNELAFTFYAELDSAVRDRSKPLRVAKEKFVWNYGLATAPLIGKSAALPKELQSALGEHAIAVLRHPACAGNCKDFEVACSYGESGLTRADAANGISEGRVVVLSWLRFGAPTLGGVAGAMLAPGQAPRWNETTNQLTYRRQNGKWAQVVASSVSRDEACARR